MHEHEAAACAIRAMWREIRADRLEAQVLTDLFAAGKIADEAERQAAKATAFKALGTLLRYRSRIEREHDRAMADLESLRQRRAARSAVLLSEPDAPARPPAVAAPPRLSTGSPTLATTNTSRGPLPCNTNPSPSRP